MFGKYDENIINGIIENKRFKLVHGPDFIKKYLKIYFDYLKNSRWRWIIDKLGCYKFEKRFKYW